MRGILLNHNPARTWVTVVTEYAAYLNDSGHPAGQPYVVAAGAYERDGAKNFFPNTSSLGTLAVKRTRCQRDDLS
jgi:hypothetical protein